MPWIAAVVAVAGIAASVAGAATAGGGDVDKTKLQNPLDYGPEAQNLKQQEDLVKQMAAQNGVGNQTDVYNQQQQLADQLGLMAQGQGPNPALAQLAETTGQNVAQQASLAAGQRGAGANAGMIARQAAQAGAGVQQSAIGQAATLRANQQLAAVGQLQNQQSNLQNAATQQVSQQTGALQNLSNTYNTVNQNHNQQILQQQQALNELEYKKAADKSKALSSIGSKASSGASSMGSMQMAEGGEIPIKKENYKGSSKLGSYLFAQGGSVRNMKSGGHVAGKPKVGGAKNSYANDTVPALLSPGEIVLPRSVTKSSNPSEAAKRFVEAVNQKKKAKK